MSEVLELVRADSRLKAQATFPYSRGRIVIEPATGKEEFKINWIPKIAVEELGEISKSWKHYTKKEQIKVKLKEVRKENEKEAELRIKSEEKVKSRQAALKEESQKTQAPPTPQSSEEIESAVTEGKEQIATEAKTKLETLETTLTEKLEAFGVNLSVKIENALEPISDQLKEKIEPNMESIRQATEDLKEKTEAFETLKTGVADLYNEADAKVKELTALASTLSDKFKKDCDQVSKKHIEALKKAKQ